MITEFVLEQLTWNFGNNWHCHKKIRKIQQNAKGEGLEWLCYNSIIIISLLYLQKFAFTMASVSRCTQLEFMK